jgi:mycothiol synthase
MAGFHWTKVHGGAHEHVHADGTETHSHSHGHEPLGEVYVIGVRPEYRGTGLGRALLLAGLEHLRRAGLTQAMLYVDAANESAIHLYADLGFTRWDTDVLYRRSDPRSLPFG